MILVEKLIVLSDNQAAGNILLLGGVRVSGRRKIKKIFLSNGSSYQVGNTIEIEGETRTISGIKFEELRRRFRIFVEGGSLGITVPQREVMVDRIEYF